MTDMTPSKLLNCSTSAFGIGHLLHVLDYEHKDEHDADAIWLFDTIIPPFQRQVVWNEAMMSRFITSIWQGVDIGRYIVNDIMDNPSPTDGRIWHKEDHWLIDGQQRLTAIDRYVRDKIAIQGEDGRLWLWSDLSKSDHRKFGHIGFPRGIVRMGSEYDLRVLYDTMNFGGMAHTQEQRALPEGIPENWEPSSIR